MNAQDFNYVDYPQPHVERAKEILGAHPELRELMGPYPWSAAWILGLLALQFTAAFLLRSATWWLIVPIAYFGGAFANHALYALVHECTHNLVLRGNVANRIMGLICDFALILPGSMGFRKYHQLHHRFLGEYDRDPDGVSVSEGRAVGNRTVNKTIWMALFVFSQGLVRPLRLREIQFWDRWMVVNVVIQAGVVAAVLAFAGPRALTYLALSTAFALGLHPLGGRWIQEHYVSPENQETYSYYGLLNRVSFNVGYHNEHHDLPRVSWKRLPELHRTAAAFYDPLHSYTSWTAVLWNFVTSRRMSPLSRVIRPSTTDRRARVNKLG